MKFKSFLVCLLAIGIFSQNLLSQNDDIKKRKMTIVTKTVDENGKETVTTVVKEGADVSDEDIDKLIQMKIGDNREIDVNVEVEGDEEHIIIKDKKGKKDKHIKIIKDGEVIEIDGDGESMMFITEDGEVTKFKDGKEVMIIKKKGGDEEDILIEEIHESHDGDSEVIIITKDGDGKTIKKIKKKKGGSENDFEFKMEGEEGQQMIWIEKEEGEKGEYIIIEEVKEETDENGKKTKTVKKKRIKN